MLAFIANFLSSFWCWICGLLNLSTPNGLDRRLGTAEQLLMELNQQGFLYVNSVVFMSTKEPLNMDKIKRTLIRLMKIHPLLHMHVVSRGGVYYWKRMENIEPDFRVDYSTDWHAMFSQNCMENFSYDTGPLWRVTFMPNAGGDFADEQFENHSAFIMCFCHSIIDGQARLRLINDFQTLLTRSFGEETLESSMGEPTTLKVPPSFDDFIKDKLSLKDKLKMGIVKLPIIKTILSNRVLPLLLNENPFEQCVGLESERNENVEATTCMYPMVLSEEDTTLIIKGCKKAKVTVHSVLQAASVISLSEIMAEGAKKDNIAPENIATSTTNCTGGLRNEVNLPSDVSYIASLMYAIHDDVNVPKFSKPEVFWELTKHTMDHIHSDKYGKMRSMLFAQHLFLNVVNQWPRRRLNLLAFTNLGNCNYLNRDSKDGIKITGHFSCCSEHLCGPVFSNTMATFNNRLYWGVGYYTNVTSRDVAARYLHRAVNLVLHNCRQALEG